MKRSLSLRREALTELPTTDLAAVAGGLPTVADCGSNLDYISCHWWQCILRRTVRECVDTIECA